MRIEEIEKLANDQHKQCLRVPKSLNGETMEKLMMTHKQFKFIIDKIIRNSNKSFYLSNSMFAKCVRKQNGINCLKEIAQDWFECYSLNSELGNGIFFDAHELFLNGEYPKWIKRYHCFTNTHLYILQTKLKATILSGIAFIGKPFLHSVLLIGDNIIDFNYDLVISKDLYFALTHFEVLSTLNYKSILENEALIRKMKGVQNYVLNFAFEEVIDQEKAKQGITDGVGV